ncbi:PREDICTED: putative peptide/nitrate transporter At5g19640-like [Fragaria vesca subsp. vesca]
MTGDKNKDVAESSEVLNISSIDIEQKRNSHEIEQQSNFHEIELKKISLDGTEEKRDSHDPEGNRKSCVTEEKINHSNSHNIGEKADSHEHEGKINSHEGDEPPEKGTITTRSPNAPIIKKKRGGWKLAILLLANQGLATLAFFGVGVNLVLFLVRVLEQSNSVAANNVSKWTGTVYLFSLVGAFLSDSYWGRYLTCAVFQVFFVMGLGLMTLTSWIFLIHPSGCGNGEKLCNPPSETGVGLFYLSIYLVAFGYGGHQPTIATFGADQFDEADPEQQKSRAIFFSYFYFALNVGCLFSNTILVYYEDQGYWNIGFVASLGSAVVALLSYLMGSSRYRYIKPCGNPLPRVAQVFVAAAKKWHVVPADADDLYEMEGKESAIKGSRKILHSNEIEFLDKAATITDKDQNEKNPWRLCTVTQVEEAKCVLKLLPIWLCTIIYSVIFTQMASLFVEQGDVMHAKIGNFHIPAASMSAFDICSVLIATGIYRQVLVPLAGRLSGNPKGLSELQRMGIGLIIGLFAMVAAGVTEIARRKYVEPGKRISSLSIFWQIPQYVCVGVSEVFMYVGQLEFFNGEAPDGIKSFGSSLCMASISLGNYVSSMLVAVVMGITARGSDPGWIPNNLNEGHMDRFYFLIAGLAVIDFVIYVYLSKRYKYINLEGPENEEESQESRDDEVLRCV